MRLALLWALLMALAPTVLAQGNETTGETPVEPDEGPAANETPMEPAGPLEIVLEGYQDGGAFWWQIEGSSQRNPTITVAPGQQVIFHVKSVTGVHNLAVGDQPVSPVIAEGDEADYTWTAPTTPGPVVYICKIHGTAMSGKVQVGEAPAGGGAGEGGEITGETVDLGDVGHPECAGHKIPAVATRDVVGGPTVDDYVKACKSGGVTTGETRAPHPADYVIPISFALIGLGVVGVVWAHRFYKP